MLDPAASHRQQRAVLMAQLQIMDPQGAMVYLASRQVSFRRARRDLLAPFARSPGVAHATTAKINIPEIKYERDSAAPRAPSYTSGNIKFHSSAHSGGKKEDAR